MWTEKPTLLQSLLPEADSFLNTTHRGATVMQSSFPTAAAMIAGTLSLAAIATALSYQVRSRKRVQAARAEAHRLQQRIDEALEAQAAAEKQVGDIQTSMADKAAELRAATTAKHIAEAQVEDLQERILDLQNLRAAAARHGSETLGAYNWQGDSSEEERQALVDALEELNQTITERDNELLILNRELSELTGRLPREVQEREEAVNQVRVWLDQAQGQLQHTQTALNVKEKECRDLEEQLEAQKSSASVLQEALESAKGREAELEAQQEAMAGEMRARVASVMDLMKTTRLSLSQKLMQSQSTCQALAQELAARDQASRSVTSSPLPGALREGSKTFEGFVHSPKTATKTSSVPFKGENIDPLLSQTPSDLRGSLGSKQSRSPYWFAKGQ